MFLIQWELPLILIAHCRPSMNVYLNQNCTSQGQNNNVRCITYWFFQTNLYYNTPWLPTNWCPALNIFYVLNYRNDNIFHMLHIIKNCFEISNENKSYKQWKLKVKHYLSGNFFLFMRYFFNIKSWTKWRGGGGGESLLAPMLSHLPLPCFQAIP